MYGSTLNYESPVANDADINQYLNVINSPRYGYRNTPYQFFHGCLHYLGVSVLKPMLKAPMLSE